jgi:alkyl hydroperoxide reductase subunit AhpC
MESEKMLGIGQKFPEYSLTGVVSNDLNRAFQPFSQNSHPGKWRVLFFWPKDFTFVCPTEIAAFGKLEKEFKARDAQLLGVSIDSEFVHHAWRREKEELRNLPFPMLSDIKRELTTAQRATYIVDPQGIRALRVRDGPERRPQPGRSDSRTGRAPDGRAVPLQLAEG